MIVINESYERTAKKANDKNSHKKCNKRSKIQRDNLLEIVPFINII